MLYHYVSHEGLDLQQHIYYSGPLNKRTKLEQSESEPNMINEGPATHSMPGPNNFSVKTITINYYGCVPETND